MVLTSGKPWLVGAEEVAQRLATDPHRGLSAAEAAARQRVVGPNQLEEKERRPAWRLFAEQFTNTMIRPTRCAEPRARRRDRS